MQKPSPHFVQKLEQELRLLYRTEHQKQSALSWKNIFYLLIPVSTGALVLTFLMVSGIFQGKIDIQNSGSTGENTQVIASNNGSTSQPQSISNSTDKNTAAPNDGGLISNTSDPETINFFYEGMAEEAIMNDFDGDTLSQIEQGVTLALALQ